MLTLGLYGFPLLGLATLVLGIMAWLKNSRNRAADTVAIKAWSVFAGMLLAAGGFFLRFPLGQTHKVYGFPFPVSVFERAPQGWVEYLTLGEFATLAIVLNAIVFGLLPQFWLRKRLAGSSEGAVPKSDCQPQPKPFARTKGMQNSSRRGR
jgi:hypothetical protein